MAAAQWKGEQTPATNHYKVTDLYVTKTRPAQFTQNSKSPRFKPWVKSDEPSPVTFGDKTYNSVHTAIPRTLFSKEKGKNFMEQHTKKKNFVPSPASYNPDQARNTITLGARKSYK
jgi:hypothetical protein